MADRDHLENAFSMPKGFKIHQVRPMTREILRNGDPACGARGPASPGTSCRFRRKLERHGLQHDLRPQHLTFPLPTPEPGDNLLELNLTSETLSFNASLGSIPNRGML